MFTFVFGNNQDGQLGMPCLQDTEKDPLLNDKLEQTIVKYCALSLHQTSIITDTGVLLTCGANDHNELGRSGKRSAFNRVDALETLRVRDVCYGDGFCIVIVSDGRIMSWGKNDLGQLGSGTREYKEKVRFTTSFSHRIIQVSAGSQHVVALTREGNVIAWGGNRKGQLGDGQFTSCCEAKVILELRHRPVVLITCGEEHSLALTSGGSVYSWGDNSQGQLGLGDCQNRLRPVLIRTLKAVKVVKVAAGGHHSLAISDSSHVRGGGGLLFTFGSNSCGQLGQQDYRVSGGDGGGSGSSSEEGERLFPTPKICERLTENYYVVDGACGKAHSLVVCREKCPESRESSGLYVFSMGLNSMGQCGASSHSQCVTRPAKVQLPIPSSFVEHSASLPNSHIHVYSGPLANHSVVSVSSSPLPGRLSLPSVDISALADAVHVYTTQGDVNSLTHLREMIADSYASLAVLNASFKYQHMSLLDGVEDESFLGAAGGGVVGAAIGLDMFAVRHAYSVIMSAGSDQVVSTLGRATLVVSDKLKECLFDDPENLSVFLIVLENPLLLHPASFHVALQRVVSGILAIPQTYRVMFFGWLKYFPSEYFSRIVAVMQSFLTFILTDRVTKLDPTPVVLVLESLYLCNLEASIIPTALFNNSAIASTVDLVGEWKKYQTSDNAKVFNFFSYPYLIPVEAKYTIISLQFQGLMSSQAFYHSSLYLHTDAADGSLLSRLPRGAVPVLISPLNSGRCRYSVKLELHVDREQVLESLLDALPAIIMDDPKSLLLPVCARFSGETDVVDEGGVTKELFTLAIREFVSKRSCLGMSGAAGDKLFFTRTSLPPTSSTLPPPHPPPPPGSSTSSTLSEEYLLGIMVGLACYNGVLVNLPLVDIVYKLFYGGKPTLDDLRSADPELAKNIKMIAEYSGDENLLDIFGVNFTASSNPLLSSHLTPAASEDGVSESQSAQFLFIDLKENGSEIEVDRSNRKEFVDLYVRHALYTCCKEAIDDYLRGLRMVLGQSSALSLCTSEEIEYIICGSSDIEDIGQLRLFTSYLGEYHDKHPVIEYFWSVLSELSVFQQRRFLFFVTATDRIPVGGLSMIKLTIQPSYQDAHALPAAHTCFSILDLPVSYPSPDVLKERLLTALRHSQGFGLA